MRKYSMVLAATVVAGLAASAMALEPRESALWFDVRPTVAAINAPATPFTAGQGAGFTDDGPVVGGPGSGQVLRICPRISNNYHSTLPGGAGPSYPNFDADNDASTGSLYLYMDVLPNQDSPLGANDVISSVGVDMAISAGTLATRYEIGGVNWTWTLTDASSPVNYGFANGVSTRAGVTGAKYVKVPVNGSSLYATAGGLVPTSRTQLGRLAITAANRDSVSCLFQTTAHATNSTYNVNLSVNNLLITRTFSTGGDATPEESVSFGYTGGNLEGPVSGNLVGGAGVRDAQIQVRMKDDTNGSGHVTSLDGAGFTTAVNLVPQTNLTQTQRYLYDRNNSGTVTSLDAAGFTNGVTAPCP